MQRKQGTYSVSDKELQNKVNTLERDLEMLRVQNQTLRKQIAEENLGTIPITVPTVVSEIAPPAEVGTREELRQQLHTKWENEKKLQKRYCMTYLYLRFRNQLQRVSVLEKRLQDKIQECEDSQVFHQSYKINCINPHSE
jgi:hypothetical protein